MEEKERWEMITIQLINVLIYWKTHRKFPFCKGMFHLKFKYSFGVFIFTWSRDQIGVDSSCFVSTDWIFSKLQKDLDRHSSHFFEIIYVKTFIYMDGVFIFTWSRDQIDVDSSCFISIDWI